MLTRLKLWNLERKIKHLENYEDEMEATLKHIRNKLLPALRSERNNLMYPKRFA